LSIDFKEQKSRLSVGLMKLSPVRGEAFDAISKRRIYPLADPTARSADNYFHASDRECHD
jgi:hypothetical protein